MCACAGLLAKGETKPEYELMATGVRFGFDQKKDFLHWFKKKGGSLRELDETCKNPETRAKTKDE
jgi:hypothetical protein